MPITQCATVQDRWESTVCALDLIALTEPCSRPQAVWPSILGDEGREDRDRLSARAYIAYSLEAVLQESGERPDDYFDQTRLRDLADMEALGEGVCREVSRLSALPVS